MNDFWSMGGYGFYVWSSYALLALLLIWDALAPGLRERAALRASKARQRRDAARQQA
jgi:heme exporter protein D